jgi:hypothetical protein
MRHRLVLALAAAVAVAATVGAAIAVDAAGRPARAAAPSAIAPLPLQLSGTGLYADGSMSVVRSGNVAFSPQYPLWSDGATKRRWINIPAGRSIDASNPDAFQFPPGTKLWKEFGHGRPIETRYIERLSDGSWRYATYVWNADGTEATLAPEDGIASVAAPTAPGGRYAIPSRNDCLACHEGQAVPVLGFSALQLSRDRDEQAPHAEPRRSGDADLADFVARGIIRNLPRSLLDDPPRIVAATPAGRAALGYMHANCGHCHNATGAVAGIELVLAQSAVDPAASAQATLDSLVGHASRFQMHGGGATARVVPGKASESVIAARMQSTNPLTRMPPLGVSVSDAEGIGAVERWIQQDLTPQPEITP